MNKPIVTSVNFYFSQDDHVYDYTKVNFDYDYIEDKDDVTEKVLGTNLYHMNNRNGLCIKNFKDFYQLLPLKDNFNAIIINTDCWNHICAKKDTPTSFDTMINRLSEIDHHYLYHPLQNVNELLHKRKNKGWIGYLDTRQEDKVEKEKLFDIFFTPKYHFNFSKDD